MSLQNVLLKARLDNSDKLVEMIKMIAKIEPGDTRVFHHYVNSRLLHFYLCPIFLKTFVKQKHDG